MHIEAVDWEHDFDPDRVITDPEMLDKSTMEFSENGLFSTRIFGKGDASSEVFQCNCKEAPLEGNFLRKEVCPKCGCRVESKGSSLELRGWIDFGEYYILKPFFYKKLQNIVSQKHLEDICSFDPRLTIDGNIEKEKDYRHIGLTYFREHFDEVLDYLYENSNKDKKEEAYEVIKASHAEGKVWINKHPVYSSILRPAIIVDKSFQFAKENKSFNQMLKNACLLKSKSDIERTPLSDESLLFEIQKKANEVYDSVIANLSGKRGRIQMYLLGNRINFSARTVILPNPIGTKINELYYPYLAAVELFKYEIINILFQKYGSYKEAINRWTEATLHFSQEVYDIMEQLRTKTKGGLQMMVNRNPTIELGSVLRCVIAYIKPDIDDYTLGVHNFILKLIAGDHDGDVILTASLKDNAFKEYFEPFDPRNLLISNNDGLFSRKFEFEKDYALGFKLLIK